jgi:putative endonuclease
MKPWFVYIIECSDGTLYTGITVDVEARIKVHNEGLGAKYTKPRRPVKLWYTEKHRSQSQATKRERKIKKLSRKQKLRLIGYEKVLV